MSKDLSAGIVYELCPICGKSANSSIIMNKVLRPKYAKQIEELNGKVIGFSKDACEECSKHKDECIYVISVDSGRSDFKTMEGIYRTGHIVGVRKDFQLFIDHPEFILKTDNGVQFCFMDDDLGKQLGFFK